MFLKKQLNITMVLSIAVLITGCSFLNVFKGSNDFCRVMYADLPVMLASEADSEKQKESPQGFKTKPFDQANWDTYWNTRAFHIWDIGEDSCEGTYKGISGEQIVLQVIEYRKNLGLPDVQWDDRNANKGL